MLNGAVNTNSSARQQLTSLLGAPREVKSTADLGIQLLRNTSVVMANSIQQEIASKLPLIGAEAKDVGLPEGPGRDGLRFPCHRAFRCVQVQPANGTG